MSRTVRWLVAAVVTMAAFGVSLWVCGALLLPLVLKSGADRWVVAAGLGVAVAALAALWGAWWAGREAEASSSRPEEVSISTGGDNKSISTGGDNIGILSTGDDATNIQQK